MLTPSYHATRNRCFLALSSLMLLLLIGCVEQSIVFKVLHDGTALIHVRSFTMPPPFWATKSVDETQKGVSETLVADIIKEIGPGVTVKSNESCTNSRGWAGTELILLCDDVNSLKVTPKAIELLMATSTKTYPKDVARNGKNSDVESGLNKLDIAFELNNDQLVINLDWNYEKIEPAAKDRAKDPFANRPATSNLWNSALFASVLRELRMGIFVETERKIMKSNATYAVQSETLLTIFQLDGSMIDVNKFNELGGKRPTSHGESRALLKDFQGLDVETLPKVIVELK